MLRLDPRALCMIGQHSAAELENTGVLTSGRDLAKGRLKLNDKPQPRHLVGLCDLDTVTCL